MKIYPSTSGTFSKISKYSLTRVVILVNQNLDVVPNAEQANENKIVISSQVKPTAVWHIQGCRNR